jgi:hypothetical protein
VLAAFGSSSYATDSLWFHATHLPHNVSSVLFTGDALLNGGLGFPVQDGLVATGGALHRIGLKSASPSGEAWWGPGLGTGYGLWLPGSTQYFQAQYRDNSGPCGQHANFTSGVSVTITP